MLRPYQKLALDLIRKEYAAGNKKPLLYLATGAGKTVVFCEILKSVYEKKNRALMVVRGRKLIHQASQRLAREGVPHGIMMAGSDQGHHNRILVCSIDTMRARGYRPPADLIVIDEAHLATSPSYVEFLKNYPSAYFLPVTATPFPTKSLRHCANKIISPITMRELTDQGYLVPGRFYAPTQPDLRGVEIQKSSGDYNQRQLGIKMDKSKLVGDIVENWKKYGEGRPTVAFAVTVAHSQHIAEEFNRSGIPAIHCDANSPDAFRERTLERLRRGEIKIITNVGLFGIGVDMPYLSCQILARPTQSVNLYLQQMGRGMRPSPGKNDCRYIDHAGNILRHGFPAFERDPTLDGSKKVNKKFRITTCQECFAVVEKMPCTECGFVPDKSESAPRQIIHEQGELSEITSVPKALDVKKDIAEWMLLQSMLGFKPGFAWAKCKEKYGYDTANFYLGGKR